MGGGTTVDGAAGPGHVRRAGRFLVAWKGAVGLAVLAVSATGTVEVALLGGVGPYATWVAAVVGAVAGGVAGWRAGR